MRRSITLGLAAATAVAALGLPALATAANAAPASAASHHYGDWDYDGRWGTYWSSNRLAKANGYVDVDYKGKKSNRVHITGKLYDNDYRTYRRGGKCAFVKFRVSYWDGGKNHWSSSYKTYKYCGAGGYKKIDFWRYDVAQVQAQVCQIGQFSNYPVKCGQWRTVYNAYDHHYGYHA
ncbi:hypothetical protein GCM10010116_51240 [Microbispora rosea subsp. aerata]|nr:hypothetical protein [Microbispora rosea]GGO25540.1 hypothetical protein GCM10010116_51240 [Microbispora rosea subsp. aerata]GIH58093.1 hypothetical protein Mro02_50070 [Microbispora rosea subsp. aerata]GLJ86228.1 hypothetical protein GCM10017588_49630 [Microbispora rosea subsp. aerata]